MKVIEIIKELQKQGNAITYRKRNDGGYIITQINGSHYKGASGNNIARDMLGGKAQMSSKMLTQRKSNVERYIKIPRTKTGKLKRSKIVENLTKEEKKKIRELQYLAKKSKMKSGINAGTISRLTARKYKKKFGSSMLEIELNKRIRYYQGYAYTDNVQSIIDRLSRTLLMFQNKKIQKMITASIYHLNVNLKNVKESYINTLYQKIYELEKIKSTASAIELYHYIFTIV